ncbi:putative membrane protein YeaQ/YmgE (transglycosylase-associated protein family) [Streptomyces sp. SAI-149]|nr:putative membrane protein YeaQ/YmgE (transglycosylase-associated protein family) [Streptomyces sp. SAI-149]
MGLGRQAAPRKDFLAKLTGGRLVDETTGTEIARYTLTGGGRHTGQIMAKVRRGAGGWEIERGIPYLPHTRDGVVSVRTGTRMPPTTEPRSSRPLMEISGIISAIVIGIVIGVLGRLVVPGRQRIGILWTIAVGIIAAFVGSAIAAGLDVADTNGVDWIEWLIQIALAAVGVVAISKVKARH